MVQHFIATALATEGGGRTELFVDDDDQVTSLVIGGNYCIPVSGRHFERVASDLQTRGWAFVVIHALAKSMTGSNMNKNWPRSIRVLSTPSGEIPDAVEIYDLPF